MHALLDALFLRTWWRYDRDGGLTYSELYHWFNILEGCAWLVFAVLVLLRYLKYRCSSLELWYAGAFVVFALSDFREAWVQQSWLIWLKLINLIALFYLRRVVKQRFYPSSKVF